LFFLLLLVREGGVVLLAQRVPHRDQLRDLRVVAVALLL